MSCSAGHLHICPVCCSWSTEGQKIGLVWFTECLFWETCSVFKWGFIFGYFLYMHIYFNLTGKHNLISKDRLFKYWRRCARHPTRAHWWHSHSGNVEQSDVTGPGTVYWKFRYFVESPWDARKVLILNSLNNVFHCYSLTLQLILFTVQTKNNNNYCKFMYLIWAQLISFALF